MTQMEGSGAFATVTEGGISVTSTHESAEQITEALAEPDKVSEAAAELGKRGGKASAEKRASVQSDAGSETDDPEGTAEVPEAEPEKPLGKPRDDPKARMLEATRKEAEAKKEARALREENERLRREFEAARPPQPTTPEKEAPAGPKKPDPADYAEYEAYIEALSEWKADQRYEQRTQEDRKNQEVDRIAHSIAAAVEKDVSTFQGKMQEAITADPGFVESIPEQLWNFLAPSWQAEPGKIHQGHVMADELMKLDHPAEILKHFAGNFEDFQRIATLSSPPAITRALARLDARFEAAPTATSPKPKVSAAKPPVRPVNGAPSVVVDEMSDDLSYEEHRRIMNARESKARTQR